MSFVIYDLETTGLEPQWNVPLQAALERLQKRQEKGLRAIRRQEMTVATFAMPDELPTAPSASEHLKALAQLFARDKEISASLRDLSFEVAAWEALLQRSAVVLPPPGGPVTMSGPIGSILSGSRVSSTASSTAPAISRRSSSRPSPTP